MEHPKETRPTWAKTTRPSNEAILHRAVRAQLETAYIYDSISVNLRKATVEAITSALKWYGVADEDLDKVLSQFSEFIAQVHDDIDTFGDDYQKVMNFYAEELVSLAHSIVELKKAEA